MARLYVKEIRLETPVQPDAHEKPSLWEVSFSLQTRENRRKGTMDSGVVRYDIRTGRIIHSDFHDHDLHGQVRIAVHQRVARKQKEKEKEK